MKLHLILMLIAINWLFDPVAGQRACPIGWIVNEQLASCYKLTIFDLRTDWDTAQQACMSRKGTLASIRSLEERQFLERYVRTHVNSEFWIGGHHRPDKMTWVWASESVNSLDFSTNTNYITTIDKIESTNIPDLDCLLMRENGTYVAEDCSLPKPYICRRDMGIPTGCDVDNGWEPVGNDTCLKLFKTNLPYTDSRDSCLSEGGDLAVVNEPYIQSFLKDEYKLYKKRFWIGLSDLHGTDGALHWVDNHFAVPSGYWAPGQPKLQTGNQKSCTVVGYDGLWSIESCSSSEFYFCQKKPGQCGFGWTAFKNKCYLAKTNRIAHTSWYDARDRCSNYGARLVTIFDDYTQAFVKRFIKHTLAETDFWIGLSDNRQPPQKNLLWVTGESIENYTNWIPGQPKSDAKRDNCGAASYLNGQWYVTSNCYLSLSYICEIGVNEPIITNPSNIITFGGTGNGKPCIFPFFYKNKIHYECINEDSRGGYWCAVNYDPNNQLYGFCPTTSYCSSDWSLATPNCVKLYEQLPATMGVMNFADAKAYCVSQGSRIASVTNSKTQTLVTNMITRGNGVWIGIVKSPNSNELIWDDTSNPINSGFSNWMPNQDSADGDCVIMRTDSTFLGEWQRVDCSTTFSSVLCQKDPAGSMIPTPINPFTTQSPFINVEKCGNDVAWLHRPFSSSCYYFSDDSTPRYDAEKMCKSLGGSLVSILGHDEQLFVQNQLASGNIYWLGASKEFNRGWEWSVSLDPFIYTNWANEDSSGSAECSVISTEFDGRWKQINCAYDENFDYVNYNYICEKKASSGIISTTTATTLQPGYYYDCDDVDWTIHETGCYRYYDKLADFKTFRDAQKECQAEGANLVDIQDKQENSFLLSFIKNTQASPRDNEVPVILGCPDGWSTGPMNASCYKFVDIETGSWDRAQQWCTENYEGYVAAIKSKAEQDFIRAEFGDQIQDKSIWIGLKRLYNETFWRYADATYQTSFSNWEVNYPTEIYSMSRCAALRGLDNKWFDTQCFSVSNKFKFVCQKDPAELDDCTRYHSPTTQKGGHCVHKNQCPNGYFINGLCGVYNDPDVECCLDTSRLKETVWIGMYSEKSSANQFSFKWTSDKKPLFTNWAVREPKVQTLDPDLCVAIESVDTSIYPVGKWLTKPCDFRSGFICKKPAKLTNRQTVTQQDRGCGKGFKGYEKKCFIKLNEKLSWEEASAKCRSKYEAHLVTIVDRYQQAWLNEWFKPTEPQWIGLRYVDDRFRYEWSKPDDEFKFDHWDRNNPDLNNGKCVQMSSNGFWSNTNCSNKFTSICVANNILYTTPAPTTLPPVIKCPRGWGEGEGKCYKSFGTFASAERLNWFEAEEFCSRLGVGGHLASFTTADTMTSVLRSQASGSSSNIWIGLNKIDQEQGYKWSDGSAAGFFSWEQGQPSDTNGKENCVETKTTGKWIDRLCYTSKAFLCQLEKGIEPAPINTTGIDQLSFPMIECASSTPTERWTYFLNKCYYVSSGVEEGKTNWLQARENCKKMGGDLVSIHSFKEVEYIVSLASKTLGRYWIGLNQLSGTDGFVWSDGSPLNFINWSENEPSFSISGEYCVETYAQNGFWNDANCGLDLGYVCEKSNYTSTEPGHEAVLPLSFNSGDEKFCPPGYSTFGVQTLDNNGEKAACVFPFKYKNQMYYECLSGVEGRASPWCATTSDYDADSRWGYCFNVKCYRIEDSVKLDYKAARQACLKENAYLASITNDLEQSYITTQLKNRTENLWLGMVSLFAGEPFIFEDNTPVRYTKWAPNKPGSIFGEKCVSISTNVKTAGLWEDGSCVSKRPFICSTYSNGVKYASACETSAASAKVNISCPGQQTLMIVKADWGRDQFSLACDDKYYLNDTCTTQSSTTDKIRELCKGKQVCELDANKGNDLFTDPCPRVLKQLRVWYQCVNTPVKSTGGTGNEKDCVFPFKYKNQMYHECTFAPVAGNNLHKKWCCTSSDCDGSLQWGYCPEAKPDSQGDSANCPKGYVSYDNGLNCYKVYTEKKTWLGAMQYCRNIDYANLVSITSVYEQSYQHLLTVTQASKDSWIGLEQNNGATWGWIDNKPIRYTNWESANTMNGVNETHKCVYMGTEDGKWRVGACESERPFVCKVSKELTPIVIKPRPGYCEETEKGWKEYMFKCYKPVMLTRSYPEAKYECEEENAHVVSIQNENEYEFVAGLFPSQSWSAKSFWLGLEFNPVTNSFKWSDGSALSYTPFATGQTSANGRCVYSEDSQWFYGNCLYLKKVYACSRPRILLTNITTQAPPPVTTPFGTTISSSGSTQSGQTTLFTTQTHQSQSVVTTSPETTIEGQTTTATVHPDSTTTTRSGDIDSNSGSKGLSGSETFGVIVGVILGLLLASVTVLAVLKYKRVIRTRLPLIDPLLSKLGARRDGYENSLINQDLSYQKRTESITLQNPNYGN